MVHLQLMLQVVMFFVHQMDIAVGSLIRFTCAQGGDAELWIVELLTPTATGGTIESAVA